MNCAECKKSLVAHAEGLLGEERERDIALHLQSCAACRAEAEALAQLRDRLASDARALAGTRLQARVMDTILQQQASQLRRMNMIRRYKRGFSLAAASVAIVAALAALLILDRSAAPAYAIEQTIEANGRVRTIHLKEDLPGLADQNPALAEKLREFNVSFPDRRIRESWAEFADSGQLLHWRMESPQTEDGPKVAVWEKGKVEVWFKAKKSAVVLREPSIVARYSQDFYDPKVAMSRLHEAAAEGKVMIETTMPSVEGDAIRLAATWSDSRGVYLVDSETKLLQQVETYKPDGDDYVFVSRKTFLEYNEPINPAMFRLDLPADVVRIDQTTQQVGLAKGDLTDEEIAVEVVRQFFEALIAKDYAKAGQLFGGMPAARMKEWFGSADFVRIVSLGTPTPHPIPGVGGLRVPYEVDIEINGAKSVKEYMAAVRPVYNQPDRWTIHGGI